MKAAIALIALAIAGQATKTYTNKNLGLMLTYPADWLAVKRKTHQELQVPLENGMVGTVEIFEAAYRGTKESWQALQKEVAVTMKRTIERQWEEEILGVPLLMTSQKFEEKGNPRVALVGLFHNLSTKKLQFRIVAPAAGAAEAESKWREVLQSIRTFDGELPKPEDGKTPPPKAADGSAKPSPKPVDKPSTRWAAEAGFGQNRGKQIASEVKFGEASMSLGLPVGWKAVSGDASVSLINETLGLDAKLSLESLDNAGSKTAIKLAAASLADFDQVRKRVDVGPRISLAGNRTWTVVRFGGNSKGPRSEFLVVAEGYDLIWSLQSLSPFEEGSAQYKALVQLADQIIVKPAAQ